jgi:hypothetical protein
MEEFLISKTIDLNGITFVIAGGFLLLIKTLFEVISASLTKEITFRQEQRHKIQSVKTDIDIEEQRYKLEFRKSILSEKGGKSLAKEVIKIVEILEKMCHLFNAQRVTIAIYHNGVHKNFGNYSIRYDESRTGVPKVMNDYQSKPLSPYIKEIQRFELEDILLYRKDDKMTSSNTDVLLQMRQNNVLYKYVVPLFIKCSEDNVADTRQWKIRKNDEDYYLLGSMMVDIDNEILYDEKEIKINLLNRAMEIMEIYKNNPKILI